MSSAMKKLMLLWQTMSTFIFSFIISQILSKSHKYWFFNVFPNVLTFQKLSFLSQPKKRFMPRFYPFLTWSTFCIFLCLFFSQQIKTFHLCNCILRFDISYFTVQAHVRSSTLLTILFKCFLLLFKQLSMFV